MKRVVSALFFWGVINLTQSLSAEVVYHLSVLVDSNISDSIALVNLFPGNSSVSVTNPSTGRREIFTVQQRTAIGRKIALSPDSAGRLNLDAGSIVEVRLVELALSGSNSERKVNPATEYRDLVAGPLSSGDSETSFARPSLEAERPLASSTSVPINNAPTGTVSQLTSDTIAKVGKPQLPSEAADNGLPPVTRTPSPSVMNQTASPSNGSSPLNPDSLLINTDDEKLLIPLPVQPDEEGVLKPAPDLNAGNTANAIPSEAETAKNEHTEQPALSAVIPLGDPFTAKGSQQTGQDENAENLSQPQLASTLPERKQNEDPELEDLHTVSPRAALNVAQSEPSPDFSQPKSVQSSKPEPSNQAILRMGDALPIGKSLVPSPNETDAGIATLPQETAPSSIPQQAEIYFPTIGEMNPPPRSGSIENTTLDPPPNLMAVHPDTDPAKALLKSDTPVTPYGDYSSILPTISAPTDPAAQQDFLRPKDIAQPAAVKIQIIGNLNSLNLPSGYYIQLASFKDVRKTRQVYEQFIHEYKMSVIPAQVNGIKYYRCLIGKLGEGEVAETLRKVRIAGYKDAFVYKNK